MYKRQSLQDRLFELETKRAMLSKKWEDYQKKSTQKYIDYLVDAKKVTAEEAKAMESAPVADMVKMLNYNPTLVSQIKEESSPAAATQMKEAVVRGGDVFSELLACQNAAFETGETLVQWLKKKKMMRSPVTTMAVAAQSLIEGVQIIADAIENVVHLQEVKQHLTSNVAPTEHETPRPRR